MQKWAAVNENDINNKARNVSLVFERRKCKINIIAFIAEEICSWLSPIHKQINRISVYSAKQVHQLYCQTLPVHSVSDSDNF